MKARVGGHDYDIPEAWLAGFCRYGDSIHNAVVHWHQQAELERKRWRVVVIRKLREVHVVDAYDRETAEEQALEAGRPVFEDTRTCRMVDSQEQDAFVQASDEEHDPERGQDPSKP